MNDELIDRASAMAISDGGSDGSREDLADEIFMLDDVNPLQPAPTTPGRRSPPSRRLTGTKRDLMSPSPTPVPEYYQTPGGDDYYAAQARGRRASVGYQEKSRRASERGTSARESAHRALRRLHETDPAQGFPLPAGSTPNASSLGVTPSSFVDDYSDAGRSKVRDWLDSRRCFELIPDSAKVLVLDASLSLRDAAAAMAENEVHSAMVWDPMRREWSGCVAVNDLVELRRFFPANDHVTSTDLLSALSAVTLSKWLYQVRSADDQHAPSPSPAARAIALRNTLSVASPNDTLFDALSLLLRSPSGKLPLVDEQEYLGTMTASRILRFLHVYCEDTPSATWNASLASLSLVSDSTPYVHTSTPLPVVLNMMSELRVPGVPIVDDGGGIVDVFACPDVLLLLAVPGSLRRPIGELLSNVGHARQNATPVVCPATATYGQAIQLLVTSRVHQVFVVDGNMVPVGVVRSSDVLGHLMRR